MAQEPSEGVTKLLECAEAAQKLSEKNQDAGMAYMAATLGALSLIIHRLEKIEEMLTK